jgi:hypothetical protein
MKGFPAGIVFALLLSAPAWAQSPTPTATPTPTFGACNGGMGYAYGCVFAGTTVPGNQPVSVIGTAYSDGTVPNTVGEFFYSVGTPTGATTGNFVATGGECTPPDDYGNFLFQYTSGVPAGFPTLFAVSPTGGYSVSFLDMETFQIAVRQSAISSSMVIVGTCN